MSRTHTPSPKRFQHLRLVHSEEPGERAIASVRETLDKLNALWTLSTPVTAASKRRSPRSNPTPPSPTAEGIIMSKTFSTTSSSAIAAVSVIPRRHRKPARDRARQQVGAPEIRHPGAGDE